MFKLWVGIYREWPERRKNNVVMNFFCLYKKDQTKLTRLKIQF